MILTLPREARFAVRRCVARRCVGLRGRFAGRKVRRFLGRTCDRVSTFGSVVRRVLERGGLNGSTRGAAASSRVQETIRYAPNAYRSYAAGCRVAVVVARAFELFLAEFMYADRRLVVVVVEYQDELGRLDTCGSWFL